MPIKYDEFELTDSAYRHGFSEQDFLEMTHQRHLVIANRRGRIQGYEIFGRNAAGEYLLAAAKVVESSGLKILHVFHLNRMKDSDQRRFQRWTGK